MKDITLVEGAIHRPDEPRHFMEFTFPATRYVATIGEVVLAASSKVLKLSEVGHHIYDPVVYFPLKDAEHAYLRPSTKTSHCPLKGDTHYFDFVHGGATHKDVAWCYSKPLAFAKRLQDYLAFDRRLVDVAARQ
jgi:uncharacterized protein (DUF427 family)